MLPFNGSFGVLGRVFGMVAILAGVAGLFVSEPRRDSNRVARHPAESQLFQPCRDSADCAGDLLCRRGWCLSPDMKRGEAGDSCWSGLTDCRSGECEATVCRPTMAVPANNGYFCENGSQCRSGVCGSEFFCKASMSFKGFAGAPCGNGPDCFSGTCRPSTRACDYGPGEMACAPLATACESWEAFKCCSGICSYGVCAPRSDSQCSYQGACAQAVGKTCAGPGQSCQFDPQCCSLRCVRGQCLQNPNAVVQPCLQDNDCFSGRCSPKQRVCAPGY